MAKNNLHIVYTLEDIEKYFKDTLSSTERHLMEKAALSDPFLADAIEGYENTYLVSAKEHLADISNKLSPKLEQADYTLTDIERYLQGNMTAAEMHAMEKAALKDPFLADAMEGYEEVNFTQAKQQLHIVSDRISAKEETSTNYNFNDIEQYIEGSMPATERHGLERTALKEPFLSDAVEGYEQADLSIAKKHLTNIETAILGEEKEDTKIVAMNSSSSNKMWLRIAAAVIIMIGVGTTVWLTNTKTEKTELALVTPEKPGNKNASLSEPDNEVSKGMDTQAFASVEKTGTKTGSSGSLSQADTKQKGYDVTVINSAPKETMDQANQASDLSTSTVDATAKNKEVAKDDSKDATLFHNPTGDANAKTRRFDSANAVASNLQNEKAKMEADKYRSSNANLERLKAVTASKPASATNTDAGNAGRDYNNSRAASNQLRGNVVNSNGEPVPFAKVDLNRNSRRVSTINGDANGQIVYYSADTSLNANIVADGYSARNATISSNTTNTIVLQRADNSSSLAEEVAIGQKRKQSTTAEATLGKPIGGIKSFEEYVSKKKEKLKKDTTEDGLEYVEGLVELEFDVDKLGKPYNISVTNSNTVNTEVSNKAIQIVKEGPAWIADKKKKKAKVTIKL
jgi:hypothetical protein